jgi:5-methyltetrahydrofolate--homocysteine methyltransferase
MLEGRTLLDGAMGTALIARGLPAGVLPEEWLRTRPEEIAAVHREHAVAGARVLLTCTFSCAAPLLDARVGAGDVEALCAAATRLARQESRGGLVAGALGPTSLAPPLGPGAPARVLAARYARPLAALADAGVDLLWLESQHDLDETIAALGAALRTGLPSVATFTFLERDGRLRAPDGSDAESWLAVAEAEGAVATGVNCVFAGPALGRLAAEACARLGVPFVAKPSPGLPGAILDPPAFAAAVRPAIDEGARLVGGCCGATGAHLGALASALAG